ncbi:LOW QUALITY PROTEIN: uncharacterized protein LOC120766854 [Bactrocera tryoni]|uniref:LOW QUALITY PROTEIN: uncharacterized protein LOC120766854 n=1 Tax=Bactrocera tryoni TaxID=59916 RepID=UPI001A96DD40|nr:LOW QUALITY PROTEIN: uncharacterized protein LOC120766854 [Bactrocera tryoni]
MQIGGDCSLWIRSATLDFDDGLWECQVTASDFTTQDALTSQPVRLVVRVVPQRPRLEYEGAHVPPGHNITIDSGALATVKCVSHYGNPPATLKWYLGDQEIQPIHPQINNTEPDNPRTWSATSVVQVTAMRERHGDILRCLAYHESYTAKSVPVEARLDVKYAPTIRLIGSPEIDLEEDKDALILRCVADANPPASIVWRRAGRSEIASLQETLQLRPVGRRDAGLYTCQAQNSVGTSEQLSVQLDVKYPPKIVSAGPDRLTTAPLFSPAAFECVAEGNPMPSYKWVQRIAHGSKFVERGSEPRLVIDNVTYDYQGEYECRATNYINGQERVAVSEPISLQVVGAPQVLRPHPSMHTISVKRGQPAVMSLVVCADPRPHRVSWEWGSLRLEAGSGIADRFRADDMLQDSREDCYLSTLHILRTDEHDSRPYYLVVENERGTDRHAIHLNVEGTFTEPLEMSYLLGIAGGCLAAILILICLCIYAVRSKKCCFKGSSGYKSSDKDSEKADLKSRSDSTSGPQGDSIYTTPAGFHHHQQQQQQQQLQQHHQQAQQQQQQQQHHHLQTAHGSPEAMKPVSHKTTTTTKATFDGELLWQQEATEFIERFPQRRRQHDALRPSVSAGALYKNATGITTLNKRASGGELLTAQQRHQRDLFSGDLGIPEVRSHVGSMVHTFETLAMQRKLADQERAKERAWALQQQQQWEREQLAERNCKYTPTLKSAIHTTTYTYDTPTHASRHSQHGTSNSKYHQLKRKSHESRQRLIKLSKQQLLAAFNNSAKRAPSKTAHTKLESSLSAQSLPGADNNNVLSPSSSPLKRHSTLSLHCAEVARAAKANDDHLIQQYCHLDDDYRKNLFGTISSRLTAVNKGCEDINSYDYSGARHNSKRVSHEEEEDMDVGAHINVEHDEALIVSAAFDEIFASYSGIDDDEEDEKKISAPAMLSRATTYSTGFEEQMVSLSELDDDVFKSLSSSRINNIGCPGNTPMKQPPLATSTHKKAATPNKRLPTNGAVADATQTLKRKRTIMPLAKQKQRATTLHNLFDRLKATQTKVKRPFVKMPSDSLLKQDQLSIEQMTHALHKYSPQLNLYREIGEGEAAGERSDADGDFLRGSTLSQSFVRQQPNTRENKDEPKRKKSAPPPPPINHTKSNSGISGVNAVNGAPRPSFASQRAKSTNELLLDDLAVQARRYQRAASRKYAAPPTPRKQQQPVEEGSEVTQRSKPNRAISRGNGVGADIFLRGSAEI